MEGIGSAASADLRGTTPMSNADYNQGVNDLWDAIKFELGPDLSEALVSYRNELLKPDPKPGEIWKERSGYLWWIFTDGRGLHGRLLLANDGGSARPVYSTDGEDDIPLSERIYPQ